MSEDAVKELETQYLSAGWFCDEGPRSLFGDPHEWPVWFAVGCFLDLEQMCSLITCSSHFASHDDLVCKKTERRLIKLSTYKGSVNALPLLHLPSLQSLRLGRLETKMPEAVAMLVGQDLRQLQILHLGPSDHGFVFCSDVWILKLMEILISHATALVSLCLPGLKLSPCAFTNFGMMLAKLPQIAQIGLPYLIMPDTDWPLFISSLQRKPYLIIIGWWSDNVETKLKAKFPLGPPNPILFNARYMISRDLRLMGCNPQLLLWDFKVDVRLSQKQLRRAGFDKDTVREAAASKLLDTLLEQRMRELATGGNLKTELAWIYDAVGLRTQSASSSSAY